MKLMIVHFFPHQNSCERNIVHCVQMVLILRAYTEAVTGEVEKVSPSSSYLGYNSLQHFSFNNYNMI